jgi:hypothetical protein
MRADAMRTRAMNAMWGLRSARKLDRRLPTTALFNRSAALLNNWAGSLTTAATGRMRHV